jgi:hypothetical protein
LSAEVDGKRQAQLSRLDEWQQARAVELIPACERWGVHWAVEKNLKRSAFDLVVNFGSAGQVDYPLQVRIADWVYVAFDRSHYNTEFVVDQADEVGIVGLVDDLLREDLVAFHDGWSNGFSDPHDPELQLPSVRVRSWKGTYDKDAV